MKTIKYILIFALSFATVTSCLVEDTEPSAQNDQGPNLASFATKSISVSAVADGNEYESLIKMEVKGPTFKALNEDVLVTVEADPSSTAIEGTHYKFESKTITLSASNNYLGLLPITMLTEGIEAPLAEAPVLKLKITNASTGENVVANGSSMTVNFNYLCDSNLAGEYDLYVTRSNGADIHFPNETIYEVSAGYYKTTSTYRWAVGSIADDHGLNFFDVCGDLTVPLQDGLQGSISNDVYQTPGIDAGTIDPVTGVITLYYTVTFAVPADVVAVFTPK